MNAKKMAKQFASYFINKIYLYRFKKFCNRATLPNILIVDIDNTIANTHDVMITSNTGIKLKNILPYQNIKKWIITENTDCEVFYLSARNYWQYTLTKNWLVKNFFPLKKLGLAIVANPTQKLKYLKIAIAKFNEVKYIDDLSYLNNKKNLMFYETIITEVKNMKLTYYDYTIIKEINLKKYD